MSFKLVEKFAWVSSWWRSLHEFQAGGEVCMGFKLVEKFA